MIPCIRIRSSESQSPISRAGIPMTNCFSRYSFPAAAALCMRFPNELAVSFARSEPRTNAAASASIRPSAASFAGNAFNSCLDIACSNGKNCNTRWYAVPRVAPPFSSCSFSINTGSVGRNTISSSSSSMPFFLSSETDILVLRLRSSRYGYWKW